MIKIENTENLAGVRITGDLYDLEALVDAFYAVTIQEDDTKNRAYYDNSTRVLGVCYDIRHASMGDRDIVLVENGMDRELMKAHKTITPEQNVYYAVNYLYPEMIFVVAALNELIEIYMTKNSKPKNDYRGALNKNIIWDTHITTLRVFQAAFSTCVRETLPPSTCTRWLNTINDRYTSVLRICGHYLDYINLEYLKLDREKRLKKLTSISKSIVEYIHDPVHERMNRDLKLAAEHYGCSPSELRMRDLEYPEDIEW